jgi:predicted nucleic acid-binding protein
VILADTSVWVEHLRHGRRDLAAMLEQGQIGCHPAVIGELALGSLRQREAILAALGELPRLAPVRDDDALALIEARGLAGRGIGWVDVHLLGSTLVGGWQLWTLDRRLAAVARELGVAGKG